MNLKLFILLFYVSQVYSEEIIFKPNQETYQEDDNLTLTCGTSIGHNCKWFKSGREIDFLTESRYHVEENSNCVMSISPIRDDDDGRWRCELTNATKINTRFTKISRRLIVDDLNLKAKAQLIEMAPAIIQVAEGETAILQCRFNASAPGCLWTKDGEVMAIKGRIQFTGEKYQGDCSIEIKNANYRDNGNWQCCYPKTDNYPALKSTKSMLNVTVTPLDPVITINGIAMEDGAKVYVSTHTFNSYGCAALNQKNKVECWSENGNPASKLRWILKGTDDHDLKFNFNANFQWSTKSVSSHQNVKLSFFPFDINGAMTTYGSLEQTKLICEAEHTNYKEKTKSTFIYLVWMPYTSQQYYG